MSRSMNDQVKATPDALPMRINFLFTRHPSKLVEARASSDGGRETEALPFDWLVPGRLKRSQQRSKGSFNWRFARADATRCQVPLR